jgi:hypothetical protein
MEVKNMHANMTPDPQILKYVLGAYKDAGRKCEPIRRVLEALSFEKEMNAWMDELDEKEGIEE